MNNPFFVYLSIWGLETVDVIEQEEYTLFEVAGHYLVEDRDQTDGIPRYYVADEFGNQKTEAKFNPGYAVENLKNLVKG